MQQIDFQENKPSNIDLKELVLKYLSFAHWMILGSIIGVISAFLYLRYSQEVYQSSNVIKVLDNNNTGFKLPSDGMSFFSRNKINLENETEVLMSSLLMERVVDRLDLQNSYFNVGNIKESELGPQSPITIQWIATPEVINEIQATLEIELTPDGYYLKGDKKLHSFGKSYTFKGNTFIITLKSKFNNAKGKYIIRKITRDAAVQVNKGAVGITPVGKQSELLRITVTTHNAQKSADIANMLAAVFGEDGTRDRQLVHTKTIDFVNERFDFLFRELDSIESSKANYKQNQKIVEFGSDVGAILGNKSATDMELNALNTQFLLSEMLIETLLKAPKDDLLPANIGIDQVNITSLVDNYNELILRKQKIILSAGENDPAIKELKNTQADLKSNIKESLKTYKKALQLKINEIKQKNNFQNSQYAAMPFQEKAIRSIERQQQIKETLYIVLLQKREEAAVNLAITNPFIKIVDYAKPGGPVNNKKVVIYLGSFLFGFGIAFAIIYIYFLFDTKIQSKLDITSNVKVPMIAEIPHIDEADKMVKYYDRSILSEAFRMLRTNLNFFITDKQKQSQVLFVTSTIKGEGKTFASINLAITLSTLDKKVILIGADLRNPQLHKSLNTSRNQKGVSHYLYNDVASVNEIIHSGNDFNLKCDVVFSGTIPPNPAELLSNGRFKLMLEELKKEYDYIVVDTAPTLLVTDTLLITNLSDLLIFVVRANFTDKSLLNFIDELKDQGKIQNAGIVLNDVGEPKVYGYKYGYSYSYKYNYGYKFDYSNSNNDKLKKKKKTKSYIRRIDKWFKNLFK